MLRAEISNSPNILPNSKLEKFVNDFIPTYNVEKFKEIMKEIQNKPEIPRSKDIRESSFQLEFWVNFSQNQIHYSCKIPYFYIAGKGDPFNPKCEPVPILTDFLINQNAHEYTYTIEDDEIVIPDIPSWIFFNIGDYVRPEPCNDRDDFMDYAMLKSELLEQIDTYRNNI
jgi:hypothetical protein